jgi:3-phosphoshikimate 1-carboxyvinyltransferase
VVGVGDKPSQTKIRELCCRESGSTLRFLIPIALLDGVETEFYGSWRLFERPLTIYSDMCKEKGFLWQTTDRGIRVCGRLEAGEYRLPGNVSSQFVTGLLLALAEMEGDSSIILTTKPESNSYIDITVATLAAFGVKVERPSERVLCISGGQRRRAVNGLTVEGDESGAAFFGALNALGGDVAVEGTNPDTLQGDRVWRQMLGEIAQGAPELSVADCPDLAPVLMATAAACHGVTLTDTARLKIKESDRGAAMAAELAKCGVEVLVEDNRITVRGGGICPPTQPIDAHNDHRIVMAMAILLSRLGGSIVGAEAVSKSMPEFFSLLSGLGVDVELS